MAFLKAGTFPRAFPSHSATAGWNKPLNIQESLFLSTTSKTFLQQLAGKLSALLQFFTPQPSTCSLLPLSHSLYHPASHKNFSHLCMLSHSLRSSNLPLPLKSLPLTKDAEQDQCQQDRGRSSPV